MPLLPEIPGFYYDNEKKKYFKITAAHTSTSAVYNADRVKREREEAQQAEEQRREEEAVRPLLKRSRRVSDSSNGLVNYRLRMQMGLLRLEAPRRDGELAMWATVLCEEPIIEASRDKKLSGMETSPGLGGVFTFAPDQGLRWYPQPYDHFYEERNTASRTVKIPDMEHRMTSSTILPEGKGILVASGQTYATVSLGKSGRPNIDSAVKIPEAGSIWACATNSAGAIAIGGSYKSGRRGLLSLTTSTGSPLLLRPESDVLALTYLDNNVLLSGSRNGKIKIYDTRRNLEKEITHETAIASHVSSITHLRKLNNDHYIVVNGLGGQTALQDLRYCRPMAGHQRGHMPRGPVSPVMTYKNHNKATLGLGFDIDEEQEFIAVAGEDNKIRLYSISSGQVIKTLEMPDEVSSIRFSKDADGCRDMFATTGEWVYRYHTGFPHDSDDDVEMEG
ncbi:hypothetical protein Dda_3229 [Drechslerella dactyloides]|uniref:WD40 repeat-like protein n=1 Tax=Drechslerella dactyloides TaxID=74499 RepID=A0AAD6NK57_DREDA|nr:hypothetical protein Dda_3229 [Drechslerella dactyloides]